MIATVPFFSEVNYLAVFAAAFVYFILGALWYSVFFGKVWMKGHEERGLKMTKPDKGKMGMMMVKSFAANLLCAFAMAFLIRLDNGYHFVTGIKLGVVCGCGLTFASQLMMANWQGTKTSVLVIDAFYQVTGILIMSVIISVWR